MDATTVQRHLAMSTTLLVLADAARGRPSNDSEPDIGLPVKHRHIARAHLDALVDRLLEPTGATRTRSFVRQRCIGMRSVASCYGWRR